MRFRCARLLVKIYCRVIEGRNATIEVLMVRKSTLHSLRICWNPIWSEDLRIGQIGSVKQVAIRFMSSGTHV